MFPETNYESRECPRCHRDYLFPVYGSQYMCGVCADTSRAEYREREREQRQQNIRAIHQAHIDSRIGFTQ